MKFYHGSSHQDCLAKVWLFRNLSSRHILWSRQISKIRGCKHPYYHQETLHVVTLVNEILNTTQTGQLLIVSLEELVRDLGVAEPLHRVPYRTYVPCTKNSWITTLWRFVNYHSISIDGLIEFPPLLRNNDTYLVSRFVQCGYSSC
jgi:hypothetical protein